VILQEVSNRQLTVLVVTHDRNQAQRFCAEPMDLAANMVMEEKHDD